MTDFTVILLFKRYYDELQATCIERPKHNAIIAFGDSVINCTTKDLFGKHSRLKVTNNNGHSVAQNATFTICKVLNTWFLKKNIHKGNWKLRDTNMLIR